jgi:hypothetical protein
MQKHKSRIGPDRFFSFALNKPPGWQILMLFVLARTEHQVSDGFAGIFALVEDQLHLFRNGHFDIVAAGKAESRAC